MLMQLLKGQQRLQSADRTREKGRARGEQFLPEGGANAGQRLIVKKIPHSKNLGLDCCHKIFGDNSFRLVIEFHQI